MLEIKKIYHYTLNINEVKPFETKVKFKHTIFTNFEDAKDTILNKLSLHFGEDKIISVKLRFALQHKMVATFIDDEFVSFCFFADRPFRFSLFKLKEKELYFYDCFTFEKFRGLSSIYAEVKYVIEKYRELGYNTAHVEIEQKNISSQKAFAKLGFKKSHIYCSISIFGIRIIFSKTIS
ncbi:MAG: GNAT family N-acetyltransferase [Caldisericum exile]|uniref:GNAT family N-acetyltransferase n=1 Tax=Caldisericum exile TaxID=693075 RepID=UPI003C71055B